MTCSSSFDMQHQLINTTVCQHVMSTGGNNVPLLQDEHPISGVVIKEKEDLNARYR